MTNGKEHCGILNYIAKTKNFHDEYIKIGKINTYSFEGIDLCSHQGFLLLSEDSKECINVHVSLKSFLNVKFLKDVQTKEVFNNSKAITAITNFFEVKVQAAIVKELIDDYFESYLLFEKDNRLLCANTILSEIVCLSFTSIFPIYMNKQLFSEKKVSVSSVMDYINRTISQNEVEEDGKERFGENAE